MKLEIKNITKKYGDKVALNQFSATFTEGVYGLLGPNGAGKSTLMNIICLLLHMDEGAIFFDNVDVSQQKTDFFDILGYMPQYPQLYEDFTLEEYLFYIGSLKGIKKKDIRKRVPILLNDVGLFEYRNVKLKAFSGGMKQRSMLIQALLNNPKILILDEPTAGLDPKQRIKLRNLIAKLSANKIVLVSTHVVSDIEFISKNIILIKNGNKIAFDSPQTLQEEIIGRTKLLKIQENEIDDLQKQYFVSSLYFENSELYAKVVLKENQTCNGNDTYPSLEDVYLYHFGDDYESI